MKQISQHKLFVMGESFDQCRLQVEHFFRKTTLVRYDSIEVRAEESRSGLDSDFLSLTQQAIERNHRMLQNLLNELQESGFTTLAQLHELPQGYESKTLHIISHILDGFIGIDSYFYNLQDDSHWLPQQTEQEIDHNPGKFWLIHIDCYSTTPEEAGLLHK